MTLAHRLAPLIGGAIVLVCTGANAADGLDRKPGLWETKVQIAGRTMVSEMCIDAAWQASSNATTAAYLKEHCTKNVLTRQGDKFISDTVCTFSGHQTIGHTVTTRTGDNIIHTEGTIVADSKWLGPCKAGQKPGVMIRR